MKKVSFELTKEQSKSLKAAMKKAKETGKPQKLQPAPATNLDIAKKYFDRAEFDLEENSYKLNKRYFVIWSGMGENFCVDESSFDPDVGYTTENDVFYGDFRQCLEFCLGEKIAAEDVKALEEVKKG